MTGPETIFREPLSRPCTVWIVNHYASLPDRAAGTRHYALGRELILRGADVTIFAAGFGHDTGREERLRGRALVRSEMFRGVRFVWLRTFPYRGNTWRRKINMAGFAVLLILAQLGRQAPDVVVGSTVHPFAALAAWVIARVRRARFIFEIRDLWPQTLIDLGALDSHSMSARVLGAIEAFLVRQAETVVTVLPGISAYLEGRGLPTERVRYLPNAADLAAADGSVHPKLKAAEHDPVGSLVAEIARRRGGGEVVFAYAGAHGRVNHLEVVIRAFELASRRSTSPISLLLVGDGPEKASLKHLVDDLQLVNVEFVDPVPKDRILALLAAVDVGVVHATATPVYRFGTSFNKVFDYMAVRKPIAFACSTYADPVQAAGAGRSVPPDNPEALAEAIVWLAEASPEDRARMGEAGRTFAEREHDLLKIGATFAEIVGCR